MIKITRTLMNGLAEKAGASPRKRQNYNFHEYLADTLQRMLNMMDPATYTRPHKHEAPDKREAFIVMTGKALVVQFDDNGGVTDYAVISPAGEVRGIEMPARVWHTLIALEKNTCIYEVKDGPYDPATDKKFAPWSPAEDDPAREEYKAEILRRVGLV